MRTIVRIGLALILLAFPAMGLGSALVSQVLSETPSHVSIECSEFIHIDADVSMPEAPLTASLGAYTVTLMNPRHEINPENFTKSKMTELQDSAEYEENSALVSYFFESGERLVFNSGSVTWEGVNGRKYDQLFAYRSGWFENLPSYELGFADIEDAKTIALEHLKSWNINSPTVIKGYSLGVREIEYLTSEMTKNDHDAYIDIFDATLPEHEVYYFLLGHTFNGIATVGETDSYICINNSGVVAANIARCANQISQVAEYDQMLTLDDALEQFSEYVSEVSQSIYVNSIQFGYGQDVLESDYTNQILTYKPYWYIEYQMKPLNPPVSSTKNTDDFHIDKAVTIDVITGKAYQVY